LLVTETEGIKRQSFTYMTYKEFVCVGTKIFCEREN